MADASVGRFFFVIVCCRHGRFNLPEIGVILILFAFLLDSDRVLWYEPKTVGAGFVQEAL